MMVDGLRQSTNHDNAVERAVFILHEVEILGICTPCAVNHELVLIAAGSQLYGSGVDTFVLLIQHLLACGIPLVEAAGKEHSLANIGTNGERDALLFDCLGGLKGFRLAATLAGLLGYDGFRLDFALDSHLFPY